ELPLALRAHDAVFVVLRGPASAPSRPVAPAAEQTLATLDGPWTLKFMPGRGAPAGPLRIDALVDWSRADDPGIRYFSGTATYTASFDVDAGWLLRTLMLDLGTVAEVAELSINGRPAGIAWKAPYRLDVSKLLRPGTNELQLKLSNLWVNRLIGDQQPGVATPVAFSTGPTYAADAPLRPSGLLGPVRLIDTGRVRTSGAD
uniref:glycosylhydrolase-like jelly roll fold domain-containing protein n=1 Tax=Pelomonas sp. KK5 TaxID=1855730 RepID=UPI0035195EE0